MHIGTQLVAPVGYLAMSMGERYYFLRSSSETGLATLVWFKPGKATDVVLINLSRSTFEEGLTSMPPRIVVAAEQRHLPPWLAEMEGTNFDELDVGRPDGMPTYRSYVDGRYVHIKDLIPRLSEILSSDNPLRLVNQHAKQCEPPQHPRRVRVWLFAYILHGQNIWALMRANHQIGIWRRDDEEHQHIRFGASGARGRKSGHSAVTLKAKIIECYKKYCGLGVYMTAIHEKSMTKDFGCKVVTLENGHKMYVHPEGKRFPSYGQFRHWVVEEFGLEQVQTILYGAPRVRQKLAPSKGKSSEQLANLLEIMEADAFYVKARPRSMLDGTAMPRLCVVRGVCATSGAIVGVGFSLGSETSEAYRMMLFSCAISKAQFCRLFGMFNVSDFDWPMMGLSPHWMPDRGPGSADKLIDRLRTQSPIRELPPSHAGQGKPTVESSHPRDMHTEGEPSYVLSDLNVMQMVRQEIIRVPRGNHSSDASRRFVPKMTAAKQLPTPHQIWVDFDAVCRTSAYPMNFDDAVRNLLTPIQVKVHEGFVWLGERAYRSDALVASGLLDRPAPGQSIKVRAYVLSMCVRHIWVEVDGKLIEVDAMKSLRVNDEQLFMTLDELYEEAKIMRRLRAEQRDHSRAAKSEFAQKFEDSTGMPFDSGKRIKGRPPNKKNGPAHEEAGHYKNRLSGRNAA